MRLGLLGPADDDLDGLAKAASFLLNDAKVERAIYLGADDGLEDTVEAWAEALVVGDPSDDAVWSRAACVAVSGTPAEIDLFLRNERARQRLRALEGIPPDGVSAEMFGDRVALLIYDKAQLDEEDIFSATFLIYGKSPEPLVKQIGSRWFLSPGKIGSPGGGSLVLDDDDDEVIATFYGAGGVISRTKKLPTARGARMRVQGQGDS